MSENYIHINDIASFDMDNGRRETSAEYQICILGMNRKSVVGVLSKLLDHMEIHPLEILLYRASHDSSRDSDTGFKVSPETLRFMAGLGAEGDDNPSVSGAAADSSLCTREPLGGGNPSVSLAADTSPVRGGKGREKGEAREGGDVSELDTPPKRKRRATKSAPDYRPDTFARFWAAYPRGEDKQGAIAAWDELKPDDATLHAMSRALVRQKASEEWQRGIGIPYAVRWLRRRRWEDEIKAPAPPPERAGGDLPVWN